MNSKEPHITFSRSRFPALIVAALVLTGAGTFLFQLAGPQPEKAWQSYLINFLLWSAIAQGGFLFSVVLHITKARWGRPLQGIAESFAAFFPFSFALFLILFLGKEHVFPWLHGDLHDKSGWLDLPFLFSRDALGLGILYGLGLGYLYNALRWRRCDPECAGDPSSHLSATQSPNMKGGDLYKGRMSVLGVLYIMAYTFVLSLLAFDLVMSMEPFWVSTLFGAYAFVKAFYAGLGALIIAAFVIYLSRGDASHLKPSHFHDLGKLFFGFCLLWADFFYCQFIVIWYGNIPEETSYIIQRTMTVPWKGLAWTVFIMSFVTPFFLLLNKKIKTRPKAMIGLSCLVLLGIWLEHLLLVGPALNPRTNSLPLGFSDALITLGFLGLMVLALRLARGMFGEIFQHPRVQGE